jgi:hypothetical protein
VRSIIVFIISISEGSVFSVSPVVDIVFFIEDDTKVASSCNSLDVVALKCLYFSGLGYNIGNIFAVPCGANRVDEQFEQEIDVLASVSESVDLSFIGQDDSVPFSSYCILDLDVVLLEIIDDFRFALILSVSMTKLTVSAASERVKVPI